ncbi:hypothetical protein [Actinoplanes sp. NPDC049316]|uniref:hypothetical protein n=1 Tax=Actinoplanes sp. NPDC049316 TaxID=3154727 RepID=UPI003442FF97
MIDNEDRLREAFESHEHLAPDPAQVYARVQELSRSYAWRRRGLQVAGGTVLGAGLVAGVLNLPSILPAGPGGNDGAMVAPAAAPQTPSLAPSRKPQLEASPEPTDPDQKQYDAYFNAGYDYDDALKLAKKWKMKSDDDHIGAVKVRAGQWLLDGKKLPVKPSNDPDSPDVTTPKEEQQVNAFFRAGYDYDDAARLAKMWKKATPYEAKVAGGKKLLAGESLPFQP